MVHIVNTAWDFKLNDEFLCKMVLAIRRQTRREYTELWGDRYMLLNHVAPEPSDGSGRAFIAHLSEALAYLTRDVVERLPEDVKIWVQLPRMIPRDKMYEVVLAIWNTLPDGERKTRFNSLAYEWRISDERY